MKALSIQQPWAWLIVNGYKDIENRSWLTHHRGALLIHASKQGDLRDWLSIASRFPNIPMPRLEYMPHGGLVGEAVVIDCVTISTSDWFFGPYGFVLSQQRAFDFIPYRGRLGLFEVSA